MLTHFKLQIAKWKCIAHNICWIVFILNEYYDVYVHYGGKGKGCQNKEMISNELNSEKW